eukprot:scaffold95994_cov54-Phaeocystis_antarctica.AAC.3
MLGGEGAAVKRVVLALAAAERGALGLGGRPDVQQQVPLLPSREPQRAARCLAAHRLPQPTPGVALGRVQRHAVQARLGLREEIGVAPRAPLGTTGARALLAGASGVGDRPLGGLRQRIEHRAGQRCHRVFAPPRKRPCLLATAERQPRHHEAVRGEEQRGR